LAFASNFLLSAFDFALLALAFASDFLLTAFDLPGNARQCALVLTPFLFTDDLRQVH
jgi:hypothetical protein